MDETEFRILDALSRDPDGRVSISALTREIRRLHGTAHYPNIYNALQRMHEDGVVELTKTGNSSLVSLNLGNRHTVDALCEMELCRKRLLLGKSEELRRLFDSISDDMPMGPMSLIDAERNIKLNRAELLIQLPQCPPEAHVAEDLGRKLRELEGKLNIRIDPLILDEEGFRSLLAARDRNQLKEMLLRHTALLAPDLLWTMIRNAWAHGIRIHFDLEETNPAKLSEEDLLHNLARFGYTELGSRLRGGRDIGIEYIVIALLLRSDARRIQAIPVILAKNRANYALLLFLSKKQGVQGELYGFLKSLTKYKDNQDLRDVLRNLERANVKEVKANETSIERTMRTYNVPARQ